MSGAYVQDRHCYAMGIAARHNGTWAEAFRPSTSTDPLDRTNRFLKLPESFVHSRGGGRHTNLPGDPFWDGIFDASYTRSGDYIVADTGVFFIVSQIPLLPILCVKANRIVSVSRPATQSHLSSNTYGGYRPGNTKGVLTKGPASVLTSSQYGKPETGLPTNQPSGSLSILLPTVGSTMLTTGDIITDDRGRSAVLVATEQSDLGWRLTAKMITN